MFFFFNDTATTEIYTLSLHDALPIWCGRCGPTPTPDGSWGCASTRSRAPGAWTTSSTSWRAPATASTAWCCPRSEEHTSELQSQSNLVCRLLLEKKKNQAARSSAQCD